jgi:hypothetical protein
MGIKMPLRAGKSRKTISHNIHEMVVSGHSVKQAVAASLHNADRGFYSHLTHASVQAQEESVDRKVVGHIKDADFPKEPKTDSFYKVNEWTLF